MSRRTSKVLVCLVSILLCLANRPTIAQSLVNFHPLVSYASGGWSSEQVAVADFNSDGKLDAVISNACASGSVSGSCLGNTGSVSVFLGNGDGTFQPEVSYDSGGSFTYAVTVADVNRDGKADIIATNYCASNTDCTHGTVAVLLGNGDGTFHTAQEFGTGGAGAVSSAVADFNSDGIPDIVVANNCLVGPPPSQVACQPGSIGVLLGNGDGSFQPATSIPFGYYPLWVGVGDLNGDHQPDLVVTDLGTVTK